MSLNFLYATLRLRTSENPALVHHKLMQVVLTREHPVFRMAHRLPQHLYSGKFNTYSFRLRRIKGTVKYSLPLIIGEYGKSGMHTEIKVMIRLNWVHYAFLGIIFSFCLLSFLPLPEGIIEQDTASRIINSLISIALYSVAYFVIQYEATRAKKELIRLFEAEEITTGN
jgi:hypothetical protein